MAEFPALPLWTDAYLADTAHLSHEQHGLYLLLLITMWKLPGCRIPNDDQWLARRFKLDQAALQQKLRPLVREFCEINGSWITQKRLLKEWSWCARKRASARRSAKKRWKQPAVDQSGGVPVNSLNTHTSDACDGNAGAVAADPLTTDSLKTNDFHACEGNAGVLHKDEHGVHNDFKSLKTNGPNPCEGNAPIPILKKERKKDSLSKRKGGASAHSEVEVELFARGKEILGRGAGGLIARLLKAKGNAHLALAAILTAATKQNPREYVAAMLRGSPSGGAFYDPAI